VTALVLPLPSRWARERIAKLAGGQPVPTYGSAEWHALADDHPHKWAAALVAAEIQRYEVETLADRLRVELDAAADAELDDAVEAGARRAMARDAYLAEHAARVGRQCARRLLTRD
jgi:hypothetical protein